MTFCDKPAGVDVSFRTDRAREGQMAARRVARENNIDFINISSFDHLINNYVLMIPVISLPRRMFSMDVC